MGHDFGDCCPTRHVRAAACEPLERRALLAAADAVPIRDVDGVRVATIEWQNEPREALAGRWIVRFDGYDGYLLNQQARLGTSFARDDAPFDVITHMAADGMFLVRAPERMTPNEVVARLSVRPGFRSVEPDFLYTTQSVPNDAQFAQQWGMHNTGQSGGAVDADIDAPEAWDVTTGSSSVVVGMVDTGIDYNHPELADNIFVNTLEVAGNNVDDDANGFVDDVRGWDWWGNAAGPGTPDNDPMDQNNHGTHTAGIVAAKGNNAVGVAGVNWNVKLMPLKVGGPGSSVSAAGIISAMNYVLAMKNRAVHPVNVRVTNHGWSGGGFDAAMNDALAQHAANDLLAVVVAGNNGTNIDTSPYYPPSYNQPNLIAVGAHTRLGTRAGFSNWGPTGVDLFAPGAEIRSTIRTAAGSYGSLTGTSMAAPHVAGVAALLLALRPDVTYVQVRAAIYTGVDTVASLTGLCATGGRLNARGAIDVILAIPPVPAAPNLAATSDHGQFDDDNVTNDDTPTFTGTGATPGNVIRIVTGGFQVGGEFVRPDGTWSVTTVPLSDGVRQFTARQENGFGSSGHSPPLTVAIDTVAPTISNPQFAYAQSPHSHRMTFSENVGWSVAPADFEVANLTSGGTVNAAPTFQAGPNLLALAFPGVAVLPDARYRLTVRDTGAGNGVRDVAGNAAAQFTHLFTFLRGDANGDGAVNLLDFNRLAANFGQSPRDFTQGDFDYSGVVNLLDFNLLAARFGVIVGPAGAAGRDADDADDADEVRDKLGELLA